MVMTGMPAPLELISEGGTGGRCEENWMTSCRTSTVQLRRPRSLAMINRVCNAGTDSVSATRCLVAAHLFASAFGSRRYGVGAEHLAVVVTQGKPLLRNRNINPH